MDSAMAEQFPKSLSTDSGSSPRSSAEDQTSSGCDVVHPRISGGNASETSMWEEWTQATSAVGDEMSTSNFLPDLTSSTPSSRLADFHASDMLSTWMSTFHPLSHHPGLIIPDPVVDDHQSAYLHEKQQGHEMLGVSTLPTHVLDPIVYDFKGAGGSRQLLSALGPLSPSSPLAIHNGLLNPLGDPWDGCAPSASAAGASTSGQWSTVTTTGHAYNGQYSDGSSSLFLNHSASANHHLEDIVMTTTRSFAQKPRHMDIFIGPNGTYESKTSGALWTQPMFDRIHHGFDQVKAVPASVTPMKLMASLHEVACAPTSCNLYAESKLNAADQEMGRLVRDLRDPDHRTSAAPTFPAVGNSTVSLAGCRSGADSTMTSNQAVVWPGKHSLELVDFVDGIELNSKRPKIPNSVEEAKATLQRSDQAMKYCASAPISGRCSLVSQAMDIIAIGPALNTNGKPRARRGSATDPQSIYARHRREKINERLKCLQNLVPNGAKVDIVTMLDEAIHYVKFLQQQLELLKSDDYWMFATPTKYNGMDLSELGTHSPELESSA